VPASPFARVRGLLNQNPIPVLGYGCLAVGALMVFAAALSEAALAAARALGGEMLIESTAVSGFAAFQLRHHVAFAVGQAILGVITCLLGMAVLRRRPWARRCLEALTWLGIVANVAIAPFLIQSYRDSPRPIFLFVAGGTIAVTIALTAVSLLLIRFLRSSEVRQVFRSS
jgi:hypothetical protein